MTISFSIIHCHSIFGVEMSSISRGDCPHTSRVCVMAVFVCVCVCDGVIVLTRFDQMALRRPLKAGTRPAIRCIKTFLIYDPWTSPQKSVWYKKKQTQVGKKKAWLSGGCVRMYVFIFLLNSNISWNTLYFGWYLQWHFEFGYLSISQKSPACYKHSWASTDSVARTQKV